MGENTGYAAETCPNPSLPASPPITTGTVSNPTGCRAINNVIEVTPEGGSGACHDLQQAIDIVAGEWYTIHLAAGDYYPQNKDNFSLKIINKKNLRIVGETLRDPSVVKIHFSGHIGGILFENSTAELNWLQIIGNTTNGIVNIKNSSHFLISRTKIVDNSANAVQIDNGGNIFIRDSEVTSSSVAIYPRSVEKIVATNNLITKSQIGIESFDSNGEIKYNIISDMNEAGIFINDENSSWVIERNTITGNPNIRNGTIINKNTIFSNNIVSAYKAVDYSANTACALKITNASNADFHNNKVIFNLFATTARIFCGENCPAEGHCSFNSGEQGNISADPKLVMPDNCIFPFSPAVGAGENGTDIGAGNRCPISLCPQKVTGDANCDGVINLSDFFIWRREFLQYIIQIYPPQTILQSDFNTDNKVDLKDFFIWRKGFLIK